MLNFQCRKLSLPLLFMVFAFSLKSQQYQDCQTPFPVCSLKTYHIGEMSGFGHTKDKMESLRCSSQMQETNSFWFEWKVTDSGILTFVVNPENVEDDIDFVLFRKSGTDCTSLQELRCMASGRTYGRDDEQDNDACRGNTGLSIRSVDDFEKAGCKFNDDNYLKFLQAEAGEEYLLMVNNYDSSQGFSITFEGDCTLESTVDCDRISISEPVQIVDVFPNPAKDLLNIKFVSDNEKDATIYIYDVAGKLVQKMDYEVSLGLNKSTLVIHQLEPSSYILTLVQGEFITNKQFIKQ